MSLFESFLKISVSYFLVNFVDINKRNYESNPHKRSSSPENGKIMRVNFSCILT